MGERRLSEDRWFPRYYDIVGPCPAVLTLGSGGSLSGRVVDVSRDGVGLLTMVDLAKDAQVYMEIAERKVVLQVVHSNEDLIYKGQFRVGLRRVGSSENLLNLFAAIGSIRL